MATAIQTAFRSNAKRKHLDSKMRSLGLPDFETLEEAVEEQQRMVRRPNHHGLLDEHIQLKTCAGICELPGFCPAACWAKRREYRANLIPEATRLTFGYSKYVNTVAVVRPRYQVPVGRLSASGRGIPPCKVSVGNIWGCRANAKGNSLSWVRNRSSRFLE